MTLSPFGRAGRRLIVLSGSMILAGTLAASLHAQAAQPRKASAGVFTEAQVARGKAVHQANCISCHNSVAYKGPAFSQKWSGRSAFEFFQLISTTMPQNEPGVLAREEYADITAYVLSINGFPAGSTELAPDDGELRRVRIDAGGSAAAGSASRFTGPRRR
jgi:mono/diheme cytochrome c family protein